MAIIITIFLVLLAATMWLLLTPILIEIDSSTEHYRISYKPFFSGKFLLNDYDPILKLVYPFGSKDIVLVDKIGYKLKKDTNKPKKIKNNKNKKQRGISLSFKYTNELPHITYRFVMSLIGNIKVRMLSLDLDTKDVALNGMLHALQAINARNVNFSINYMGRREVRLRIALLPVSFIPPVTKLVLDSRKFLRLRYNSK